LLFIHITINTLFLKIILIIHIINDMLI